MTTTTILLIILSFLLAAGLSFFQYYYKAGDRTRIYLLLAFLRFATYFTIFLLLINPLITTTSYEVEKTPLPVVIDNSSSVRHLGASAAAVEVYDAIMQHRRLSDKFDIQPYRFAGEVETSEEFDFSGNQSNIEKVATTLRSIHKNKSYPTILVSDGNQTQGSDFVYAFADANKVYPVVLGDTTTFTDLRITRVNVNKYAFHKNQFPVEIFVQYSGNKNVTANLTIQQGGTSVYKQSVFFSNATKFATINVLLPANRVGLQMFRVSITSPEAEKNTYNNSKNFAVEIIDQKTEVAIVSEISHPDIGSLKRSIESNSQRNVTLVRPEGVKIQDYDVVVLYQPTAGFRAIYESLRTAGVNTLTITGTATDFSFLNQQQDEVDFRMSQQSEDYLAQYEAQFNAFALDDFGFAEFPPLQHAFGTITVKGKMSTLLSSQIRNIPTGAPLLTFIDEGPGRSAYLFGENIWRWRMHDYVQRKSFTKFDLFLDKTIQYLAINNTRKSLDVYHESFYNSGDAIEISAQFFNKNYEFDDNARLTITATDRVTKESKRYDLLKANNSFKVNLDGLQAGKYDFTVRELNTNTVYKGFFEVMDFDIEKQFVNPDVTKLAQLASRTGGTLVLPNNIDLVIQQLLDDTSYKPTQRAITKNTPLIDRLLLLALLAATLAAEWFIRKYNGML